MLKANASTRVEEEESIKGVEEDEGDVPKISLSLNSDGVRQPLGGGIVISSFSGKGHRESGGGGGG